MVRELFTQARKEVWIAGFAVHQGRVILEVLARRLDAEPTLRARLLLNVKRPRGDTTSAAEILKEFADRFRTQQWPGRRLPEVHYDPRGLELDERSSKRAALHAKAIVVDDRWAFVTSASFTEAAQERNIEVGALVEDTSFASALGAQFQSLIDARLLLPLYGL